MSNLSELGISPISSRIDFLKIVNRGLFPQLTPEDIVDLIPWNLDKYAVRDFRKYFDTLVKLFNKGWQSFSDNFRALDIACGGNNAEGWYPWLPGILSQLGAEVIGIDIGTQPPELSGLYTHISFDLTDLSENGLLDIPDIEGQQFDLITFLNTINPFISSDEMERIALSKNKSLTQIQGSIFSNIGTLLKPNGILYADLRQGWQLAFRKTPKGLLPLSPI